MLGVLTKQPADFLDYDVNFEDWLTEDDTVASSGAVVEPAGELTVSDILISNPIVKLWLAGGVDGKSYKVTVTTTTAFGRVKQAEFRIRVKDY